MRSDSIRKVRLAAGLALLLGLGGCATVPAPVYQPSVRNTEALLRQKDTPLGAGTFSASPGVANTKLSVRGNPLQAGGATGTFSGYLRNALVTELKTAGRYDDHAPLQVDGVLTGNKLEAGIGKGHATVSAHFTVSRTGEKLYDRTLTANQEWDSSFIGAIAVPAAFQNYAGAVQKLIGELVSDPDFVRATGGTRPEAAAGLQ